MNENHADPRRAGAAASFVDAQLASGRVAFPLRDLMSETGLSIVAARNQLLRLRPLVVRVSKEFFLIVGPEHRAMGAPPPSWWLDDYFRWLGHPYYLALQSAAEAYGSSSQAPQITQVMTDVPRRGMQVGRIRLRFFVKRGIERTPTQPLANAFAPLRVSTPAATAYDLVRYAERLGGIGRAAEILGPLLPLIGRRDLRLMLETENEVAVAQRLGFLVETAGNEDLACVIRDWLPSRLAVVPLAPLRGGRLTGHVVERWRVSNNIGELAQ